MVPILDPVPWMIADGAVHSTQVARNVAFGAFNGAEGVVQPTSLEVRELTVPGPQVQVYPGTCAILNRDAGAVDEMYVGRNTAATSLGIAATGSTPRSDLIVMRVENPNEGSGEWPAPDSVENGPYIFIRVISGVDPSTTTAAQLGLGHSMIALARIDVPAFTSTITQAMIKDLRTLTQTPAKRDFFVGSAGSASSVISGGYVNWPATGATFLVPAWATHCRALVQVHNATYGASGNNGGAGWDLLGNARIQFGADASSPIYGPACPFNMAVPAGFDRGLVVAGANDVAIPQSKRGVPMEVRMEVDRTSGTAGAQLLSDAGTLVTIDVEFYAKPESN